MKTRKQLLSTYMNEQFIKYNFEILIILHFILIYIKILFGLLSMLFYSYSK